MTTNDKQLARFTDLLDKWRAYRSSVPSDSLYCQLRDDLYLVRNPGYDGNPAITAWPAHLVDRDDGMMAAVEHYCLCRCWVGTGVYPAWQMRTMNMVYDIGKFLGVTPRHNPNKPTTPPTPVQMEAKEAGIRDGLADISHSGKSAPLVATPPKY